MTMNLTELYDDMKKKKRGIIENLCEENNCNIFLRDEEGNTLLHKAVIEENLNLVKRLISLGACPILYNYEGVTPMAESARGDDTEILEYLFEKSNQLLLLEYDRTELLAFAVSSGKLQNVKFLLDNNFDVNWLYREDPIIYWANQSDDIEIFKLLYNHGADLNAACEDSGMTSLYDASANGQTNIVNFLLDNGVDINKSSHSGCTPLIIASAYDQHEVVRLLLTKGAFIEAKKEDGTTAMLCAVKNECTESIKVLLEFGANVNAVDNKNNGVFKYLNKIKNTTTRSSIKKLLESI